VKRVSGEGEGKDRGEYVKFLEERVKECMEENKRYLHKYSELRSFFYNQIEWKLGKK
jgi:hypothetical protein